MRNGGHGREKKDHNKGNEPAERPYTVHAGKMQKKRTSGSLLLGAKLQNLFPSQLYSQIHWEECSYQIHPATSAELTLAGATRLETERFIERNQVVVGDDRNPIGNLGLPDTLNIRLHQGATDLLALVLRQYSQRVDGNGTAALLMADSLPFFKGPALA